MPIAHLHVHDALLGSFKSALSALDQGQHTIKLLRPSGVSVVVYDEDGVIDEKEVVALLAAHRHYMAGSSEELHALVTLHALRPRSKPN